VITTEKTTTKLDDIKVNKNWSKGLKDINVDKMDYSR